MSYTDPAASPAVGPQQPGQQQTQKIEHADFASSNLTSGDYDAHSGRLLVTFSRGDQRMYERVSPEEWAQLQNAPSVGRFFREVIAGKPMSTV
jgi:KTSC domain